MLITHLELATPDPSGLVSFYTDTLGLDLVANDPAEFAVSVGASRLAFAQSLTDHRYHFAFSFPISQFQSAKAWLSDRTELATDDEGRDEFESPDWKSRNFYFYDPAGNILEFIARTGQPQPDSTNFGSQSLTAVCEIGLATHYVPATVARLHTELGLGVYDGQGSDSFTAVGDDEGLFIVVKENRIWYPDTGLPATLNPTRVVLQGGAQVHQTLAGLQISPKVLL